MNKTKEFHRDMSFCALSPNFDQNLAALCAAPSVAGYQELHLHNFETDKTCRYQYLNDNEQVTQVYSHVIKNEDSFFIVGHKIYLFQFNRHYDLMMIYCYRAVQKPNAHFTQMDICDNKLIAGILDNSMCVLDLEGKMIRQFVLFKGSTVISVKFKNENTAFALTDNNLITMVDLNQKYSHLIFNIQHQTEFNEVVANELNPNQFFAFSYKSPQMYLFDVRNGIQPVSITDYGSGNITGIKIKKNQMMSSSDSGIILRYAEERSRKSEFSLESMLYEQNQEPIVDLDFSKGHVLYLFENKMKVVQQYKFKTIDYFDS